MINLTPSISQAHLKKGDTVGIKLGKISVAYALEVTLNETINEVGFTLNSDGAFYFFEKADGANKNTMFVAEIETGDTFESTVIEIHAICIDYKVLRSSLEKFLKDNGDCTIKLP